MFSWLRARFAALGADRIAAILFIVVFASYGWGARTIHASLDVDVIGPGFFPTIIAVLGTALGFIMLIKPAPGQDKTAFAFDPVALAPAGLLLAYVLVLEHIGFPLATAVFLLAAFKYLGCPGWTRPVIYSVVATAVLVVLFGHVLGLTLPHGDLIRFV